MSCHPDGLGPGWKVWRRRRFLLVLAVFFGQVVKMILRVNMSIAVMGMTEERAVPAGNGTAVQAREFDWDAGARGLLLSSFFYGFLLTQLAGGVLAARLGAARLFGLGVLVASAVTLLSPVAARAHLRCLLALRFFEGLCEGLLGPSVQLLWARWIPLQERNRVVGFSFSGNSWGYVVGFSLSSLISEKLGWPSIFYFSGAAGILWFAVWWFVVEEYPEDRHVSPPELAYIKQSLDSWENYSKQVAPVPYFRILGSLPVWAFVLPAMAEAWFTQNMITQLPSFLRDVLRTDVENLGLLSSVQHVVMVAVLYALAPVADALTSRNILSITTVRKLYMCGFLALAGGAMALTGFLRSKAAIIASLSVAQSSVALVWNTVLVNQLDLAPQFASILASLQYTGASVCAVVTPALTGFLTQNKTAEEWQLVFCISAALSVAAACFYAVFGSGQLQPWARGELLRASPEEVVLQSAKPSVKEITEDTTMKTQKYTELKN